MDTIETIHVSVCRVCMSQSICDPMEEEIENSATGKVTSIVVGSIVIKYENTMPTTICTNCEILLKQCDRFKLQCQYNERKLKKIQKMLELARAE